MKRAFLLLVMALASLQIYAQRIEFDIFGNLEYRSKNQSYRAYLKEDIFKNLIFTDSEDNVLTYKKEYIDMAYPNLLGSKGEKVDFFKFLLERCRHESAYKVTYSVDIMGKTIIEDSKNGKVEMENDIFGNPSYKETKNGKTLSIRKNLMGEWEYRSGMQSATLKMDIFKKWIYSDSSKNKFEFGDKTWDRLLQQCGNEEGVFMFLLDTFMFDSYNGR